MNLVFFVFSLSDMEQKSIETKIMEIENLFKTAVLHHGKKNFLKAKEIYEVSLQKNPDNLDILQNYAALLAQIKNYKEAISLRPNYPKALNNLGRLLDEQNLPLEAKSILEKALILDNDNIDIRVNLANNCIALGDPSYAEKLVNNIKSPEALNTMGICKYIQRNFN